MEEKKVTGWVDVTESFSERQRHYKNMYLEIDEVYDEIVEVSLFSSDIQPYEIYFCWGIFYGIVYCKEDNATDLRTQMKEELETAYHTLGEPTSEFIHEFVEKYDVQMPSDIVFDEEAFMKAFM